MRPSIVALFALLLALCAVGSAAGETRAAAPVLSRSDVRACLHARGMRLERVRRTDTSMTWLHDLAQRTSFLARRGRAAVGVAVTPTVANAKLLVELLAVPGSGYHIVRRSNVVLIARAAALLRTAAGCAATGDR